MSVTYDPNTKRKTFSRIYAVLFFVLVIVLATAVFVMIHTDVITNSVLKSENISFLLTIVDDEGPLLTEGVLFNAETKRLALIDVPVEAGDLLPKLKRSGRFSVFYEQGDKQAYKVSIERLLNTDFLFTLDLHVDNVVKLIDLLEGIRLYFFAPIDRINPQSQKRYIYVAGEQFLDGDQSQDFLYAGVNTLDYQEYLSESKGVDTGDFRSDNILRQKNLRFAKELLLGIVSTLQRRDEERDRYIGLMYDYFDTSLSRRSFIYLLRYLSEIDLGAAEVVFQDYLGKERMVQGRRINFPVYDGQVIRSQVARISTQLQSQEQIEAEKYPVRVEVLNGTNIPRLASRTASIYSDAGFDVINIDNAERSDYEKTVVLNLHSNSSEDLRRVADVIEGKNIVSQPLPGGEQSQAEVRVILGRDFDGDRVAQ